MNLSHPRHRRSRKIPRLAVIGAAFILPVLVAAGTVVALGGDDSTPNVMRAEISGSGTPSEANETTTGDRSPSASSLATDGTTSGAVDPASQPGRADEPGSSEHTGVDQGDGRAQPSASAPNSPGDRSRSPQPPDGHRPDNGASGSPSSSPDGEAPTISLPPEPPVEVPRPTPSVPSVPPQPPAPPPPSLSSQEQTLVDATNAARLRAGCRPLRVDPRLTEAARSHSDDMRSRGFYSHVNPDGETPDDRAGEAGYRAPVAENISAGLLQGPRQVVDGWRRSSPSLLDCAYTAVGVGVESGLLSSWWTQLLGRD